MMEQEKTALHWEEYKEYIENNKMSSYERKLLRDWVRSGHSVYETVDSRYLPGPSEPPMDYLDAYRLDKELRDQMKGMTRSEKTAYLKAWLNWNDELDGQAETTDNCIPLEQ